MMILTKWTLEKTYGFDGGDLLVVRKSVVVRTFVVALFIVIALLRSSVIDRRPDGVGRRVVEAAVKFNPEVVFIVVVAAVIRRRLVLFVLVLAVVVLVLLLVLFSALVQSAFLAFERT